MSGFGNGNFTDWYASEVKPVREGAYEVKFAFHPLSFAWFGHHAGEWSTPRPSPKEAEQAKDVKALSQQFAWRGLTEEYYNATSSDQQNATYGTDNQSRPLRGPY